MISVILTMVVIMAGADSLPAGVLARVTLPPPQKSGRVSVEEALSKRRSVREFAPDSVSLEAVSQLCWAAYGVTRRLQGAELRGGLKTAPSAGATYPLELYVVAGRVQGLEKGIYQYRPENHELWLKIRGDRRSQVDNGQGMVVAAPLTLVYSAVFERTTRRYGQRGRERYVWIDLGHSAENVYLQATAMGLGTCAVGAFDDTRLHRAVGMSPTEQALYIMPVGLPAE